MPDGAAAGRLRLWYPEVGSTMDVAMTLAAAGAPDGTLVEAGYQHAGRGRMGRAWVAPPGTALLSSWLLRLPPGAATEALSSLVALAVARAVEASAPGAPVTCKWPNDVHIDGRKVAGVLLSARATPSATLVVAGVGVNVAPESVPPGLEATCLADWGCRGIDAMREVLARELGRVRAGQDTYAALDPSDHAELEQRLAWREATVTVDLGDAAVTGTIAGLAPDGALRLRTEADAERVLRVGEIARGPRIAAENGPEVCRILP